jgi:hypothetical protein
VSAHPPSESTRNPAHNSASTGGTARDVFLVAVVDVFISSFNDNGANKQSEIKINFVAAPL